MKSKKVNWIGHVTRWGKQGIHNRILFGKPVGKNPLRIMRLENNVKMDHEVTCLRMGVRGNWIKIINRDRL